MGLLEGLFKNENNKKFEELDLILKEKEKEIMNLKSKIKSIKDTHISSKQLEIFEKNLKSMKEQNNKLKAENEKLLHKISLLQENKKKDNNFFSLNNFIYKLSIEDFFCGAKYKESVKFLLEKNVKFIQEFEKIENDKEFKKLKSYSITVKKYQDSFLNEKIAFEHRVQLCKGDKINKIFKKSRKFVNHLNGLNIEFMDDMISFNFETLTVKGGFNQSLVKEFENITMEYFKTYKI